MVGHELKRIFAKEAVTPGETILAVRDLSTKDLLHDVSFELRRGEILGIAGLVGSGRTETMRALFGVDPRSGGEILIGGRPARIRSAAQAIRHGMALVPEDRQTQGLIVGMTVRENGTLAALRRLQRLGSCATKRSGRSSTISSAGWASRRRDGNRKRRISAAATSKRWCSPSGWRPTPSVLILDEPTRGIDVGAKDEIYRLMTELAREGVGIIMISSELPEILGMSDRILVMHEGRVTGELTAPKPRPKKSWLWPLDESLPREVDRMKRDETTQTDRHGRVGRGVEEKRSGGAEETGRFPRVAPLLRKQLRRMGRVLGRSTSIGILTILLALCGALWVACPGTFPTSDNLFTVARQFSYIAVTAIGELMVIIIGGIDLSVGSIMGFGAVLTGYMMYTLKLPILTAILIGLASGAAFGLFNALCVTRLRLPAFISTLGTMSIARGLAYAITKGYTVPVPDAYARLGQGYLGPVPYPVIYMVIVGVVFAVFLGRTVVGRRIYALGGNEEAAKISGINAAGIKTLVFIASGLLAAAGGIICSARLGVAQSTLALGYELDVIAAVFIGGASTVGGTGTVLGTILGAAIMGVIRNGLVLLNVDAYWVQTAIGSVIILAVALDQLRLRYRGQKLSEEARAESRATSVHI